MRPSNKSSGAPLVARASRLAEKRGPGAPGSGFFGEPTATRDERRGGWTC